MYPLWTPYILFPSFVGRTGSRRTRTSPSYNVPFPFTLSSRQVVRTPDDVRLGVLSRRWACLDCDRICHSMSGVLPWRRLFAERDPVSGRVFWTHQHRPVVKFSCRKYLDVRRDPCCQGYGGVGSSRVTVRGLRWNCRRRRVVTYLGFHEVPRVMRSGVSQGSWDRVIKGFFSTRSRCFSVGDPVSLGFKCERSLVSQVTDYDTLH